MERQDFIDTVTEFYELISFAEEIGCHACEDLVSEDYFREWIEENLVSWAQNEGWQNLMERLESYDNMLGYGYYLWDDLNGEYREPDENDFDDMKQEVLEYADEYGEWDDPDDDAMDMEEDETAEWSEPEDPEDDVPTPQEAIPIGDMFFAGVSCIRTIDQEALILAREQDKAYATLICETSQA